MRFHLLPMNGLKNEAFMKVLRSDGTVVPEMLRQDTVVTEDLGVEFILYVYNKQRK